MASIPEEFSPGEFARVFGPAEDQSMAMDDSGGTSKRTRLPSGEDDNASVRKRRVVEDSAADQTRSTPTCHSQSPPRTTELEGVSRLSEDTPLDRPADVHALDPDRHYDGHFGTFVISLRKIVGAEHIASLRATAKGFLIRTRYVKRIEAALQSLGLTIQHTVKTTEVVVRGIPIQATTDEIGADLQEFLGGGTQPLVRRLHAHTEGRVDLERPIPAVVITLAEEAIDRLRHWRLFGVLRPRIGSIGTKERVVQCFRCLAWGHRASACTHRRRCIRCGTQGHVAEDCEKPKGSPSCIACGGSHMATWAGCPKRSDFLWERNQQRLEPSRTRRNVTNDPMEIQNIISYAMAAAKPTPLPSKPTTSARRTDTTEEEENHIFTLPPKEPSLAQRLTEAKRFLAEQLRLREEARADKVAFTSVRTRRLFERACRRVAAARKRVGKLQELKQKQELVLTSPRRPNIVEPPRSALRETPQHILQTQQQHPQTPLPQSPIMTRQLQGTQGTTKIQDPLEQILQAVCKGLEEFKRAFIRLEEAIGGLARAATTVQCLP